MADPSKKSRISDEVKLGVAFILAVTVFISGLFYLKDYRITGGTYEIKARFEDMSGIKNKDPVLLGGVKVGQVIAVGFENQKPYSLMRIYEEFPLPVDSKIRVVNLSFLGEVGLEIEIGTSSTLTQEGGILEGLSVMGVQDMIVKGDTMSDRLQTLLDNANTILNEDMDRSLKSSLGNVEELTSELRTTLQQEKRQINHTLGNLDSLLLSAKDISQSERLKISRTMSNLEKTSGQLGDMITDLQGTTTSLTAIMQKIERGEGTLGKLVNDDKLYLDMNRLMVNLDGLVVDLKENPKRYINVSIF